MKFNNGHPHSPFTAEAILKVPHYLLFKKSLKTVLELYR
jgi:hypothetical protein